MTLETQSEVEKVARVGAAQTTGIVVENDCTSFKLIVVKTLSQVVFAH